MIAGFFAALPAGSHLALSHGSRVGPSAFDALAQVYGDDGSPNAVRLRTPEEILEIFGDLELVAPGLVPSPRWRPDPDDDVVDPVDVRDDYPVHAGVGRKP